MKRITLNKEDLAKLFRGEVVTQGDLQVALQDIGHAQMFNCLFDSLQEPLHLSVRDGHVPFAAYTLREDEEEVRRWIHGLNQHEPTRPGDFLLTFAAAVCRADYSNYPLMRPTVLALKAKFPKYRFSGVL